MDVKREYRGHPKSVHSIQPTATPTLRKPSATSAQAIPDAQRAPDHAKLMGTGAARSITRPGTANPSKVLSMLDEDDSVTEDDSQALEPMEEDSVTEEDSQAPVPEQDSEISDPQPPKKKTKTQNQSDAKGKAVVKKIASKVADGGKKKVANELTAAKKGKQASSDVEIVEVMKPLRKKQPTAKKILTKGIFPMTAVDSSVSDQKDKMLSGTASNRYVSLPIIESQTDRLNFHVPLNP